MRPLFECHFPSYELRVAKPDPAIFRRVAELLDVAPARIVFFDDHQWNVDSASSVGMTAHRVDDPTAARAILTAAGVIRPTPDGTPQGRTAAMRATVVIGDGSSASMVNGG